MKKIKKILTKVHNYLTYLCTFIELIKEVKKLIDNIF